MQAKDGGVTIGNVNVLGRDTLEDVAFSATLAGLHPRGSGQRTYERVDPQSTARRPDQLSPPPSVAGPMPPALRYRRATICRDTPISLPTSVKVM